MKSYMYKVCLQLLLLLFWVTAGYSQGSKNYSGVPGVLNPNYTKAIQVSEYIRKIYEDRNGNLWMGTNSDGVCRYSPKSGAKLLMYFGPREGLSGRAVSGIAEDNEGNLWFGTDGGVSKYNGVHFTNYSVKDGLPSNEVWSLLIDRAGTIWVGTLKGVCRYTALQNGKRSEKVFTPFQIPAATEKDFSRGITSTKVVWDIKQDKAGNIWFATNGGGVYKYSHSVLENGRVKQGISNISDKNGLSNNFVNCIMEDKAGHLWFATQKKGAICYTQPLYGKGAGSFINYTDKKGLCGNEVWTMLEDRSGNIWFCTRGSVCRYDGKRFTAFGVESGLTNCCVQSIYQDRAGNLWFGSGAGLFRFNGKQFINITKNGPWVAAAD